MNPTPTSSATPTSTSSSTSTNTPTPTSTPIPGPGNPPPSYPPQSILINEIAWAGTIASAYDEWIELHNPGSTPIDLTDWVLTDGGDLHVALHGTIPAYSFFLLERTDETTIRNIDADQLYTGGLNNSGEKLRLLDPAGGVVDSANYPGGWPAGDASSRATMERRGGVDQAGNWATFSGSGGAGQDAAGNAIRGTPRKVNSLFLPTATATATATKDVNPSATAYPPQAVLINEIGWAGTKASSSDEWIELHNPGEESIDLTGWKLSDGGDINVTLQGSLPAHGFYLLERTDEDTISDIDADQIYSGSLNNSGERLLLRDPHNRLIDSANGDGGGWPAGNAASRASMERRGGEDRSGNWGTFTGYYGSGRDAEGGHIQGTPRKANSLFFPTPMPTWIPGRVVINEVLIRPHYDWEGDGSYDTNDEFIELYNLGPRGVNLAGFMLDDEANDGSKPFSLPDIRLPPGEFIVFFRSQTRISLNDAGDDVRLLAPNGRVLNKISYLKVRAYNLSFGRLPDGSGHLLYGLWPTPGEENILFVEPADEMLPMTGELDLGIPSLRLERLSRHPALVCRMSPMDAMMIDRPRRHEPIITLAPQPVLPDTLERLPLLPLSHPTYARLLEPPDKVHDSSQETFTRRIWWHR